MPMDQQQQQYVSPGGPIRPPPQIQQIRSSPYPQQPPQIRPGPPPPQQQHFSPQTFGQNNQPIQMHRPPMHMQMQPIQPQPPQQPRFQMQPLQIPQQQQPPQQSQPQFIPPGPQTMQINMQSTGSIMEKSKLDDIMTQINKNIILEDGVKDALVEYADDFVTSIIDKAVTVMKLRDSKRVEGRDIEFILKNVYNMPTVPRASVHIFGQPETIDLGKEKHIPTEAHKQRLALVKKQVRKI
ncbi:unnamed protein product [Caenorhabditis angaria]|uniref:Transcription initiation factor TFIID subunit 12 n=1 Tax=Caenorhabditis angaria TaxID=860376 RepID=A0A9P1IH95_9PELO|nr:unnamed protein product [Caenorhabditis angaria]